MGLKRGEGCTPTHAARVAWVGAQLCTSGSRAAHVCEGGACARAGARLWGARHTRMVPASKEHGTHPTPPHSTHPAPAWQQQAWRTPHTCTWSPVLTPNPYPHPSPYTPHAHQELCAGEHVAAHGRARCCYCRGRKCMPLFFAAAPHGGHSRCDGCPRGRGGCISCGELCGCTEVEHAPSCAAGRGAQVL